VLLRLTTLRSAVCRREEMAGRSTQAATGQQRTCTPYNRGPPQRRRGDHTGRIGGRTHDAKMKYYTNLMSRRRCMRPYASEQRQRQLGVCTARSHERTRTYARCGMRIHGGRGARVNPHVRACELRGARAAQVHNTCIGRCHALHGASESSIGVLVGRNIACIM
jgi:hypothetical protein